MNNYNAVRFLLKWLGVEYKELCESDSKGIKCYVGYKKVTGFRYRSLIFTFDKKGKFIQIELL